jgi:hypothetical protein
MGKLYRVRPGKEAMVRDPDTGGFTVPSLTEAYPEDHALVRAYPHMFATDDELAAEREAPVEQATARPGEKRTTRR